MRRLRTSGAVHRLLACWRDERGEVITAVLVIAEVVQHTAMLFLAVVAALAPVDRVMLTNCLQDVTTAAQNLTFYTGHQVALDDPNVLKIRACKATLDGIANRVSLGTSGPMQSLRTAINSALSNLTTCTVSSVGPSSPQAGVDTVLDIEANIPLTGTGASATASIVGTGVSGSVGLTQAGRFEWDGTLTISPSDNLAGKVTQVTAAGQSDVGRQADGTCPSGADPNSPPGQCLITCTTPPFPVFWRSPPPPEIKLFLASPATVVKGAAAFVTLTWIVNNAMSVSIDQGVGGVDLTGFAIEVSPDQDTTYTLTATNPAGTKTATAKVTVQQAATVQLTAPASNSVVTSTTVPVSGTVQNAAPGQTVQISLNGVPKGSLTIVNGAFAGSLNLDKTLSLGDFFLNNLSQSVTIPGSVSVPVTMGNQKTAADVTNVITASVGASTASVTVSHAVQVTGFQVAWTDCPSAPGVSNVPQTLGAGQSAIVGYVECGGSTGFCRTCNVHVSVDTTVGSGGNDSSWVFFLPPCQP